MKGAPLRVCEDCGGTTTEAIMPGRHSPHWKQVDGRMVKVNCVGKALEEEAHGEDTTQR